MALPISTVSTALPSLPPLQGVNPAHSAAGFADLLGAAISNVESAQTTAKAAAQDLLVNGKGEIHEVALLGQRAELTLELFQQVRNKLVQAYQEVMRMPM
jgi:flagellar hook-basal body complex protein FliE